jgi:hypothetical protein
MSTALAILVEAFGADLPKQNRSFGRVPSLLFKDVLLIVGVGIGLVALLALGIYLWMKLRRKRRRHVSGGEKVYRGPGSEHEESKEAGEESAPEENEHDRDDDDDTHHQDHHGRRRYKYRVRRRTHRSRNPTLSETGGLPPVKDSRTE